MQALIAFLWSIDAVTQRIVDSVAFFLMRRFGVRKSFILYGIGIMIVFSHLCLAVARPPGTEGMFMRVINIAFACWWFLIIHDLRRKEQLAEDAGMLSPMASDQAKAFLGLGKLLFFFFLAKDIMDWAYPHLGRGETPRIHTTIATFHMMLQASLILSLYLFRTPSTPPPAKKKAEAPNRVLVPAPARR
ncbi:MAG: hypothetical protein RLZZ324_499 [Candidatus Parcubacteria bacterium]|jgi:hypothetical protein